MEKRFLIADEVSHVLGMTKKTLQNKARESGVDSVWRQCDRGVWHVEQVKLMEAVRAKALDLDVADAYWVLMKSQMKKKILLDH